MAADVSFVAAFVAGILSFLSPCVLPLVPPYLVYLEGACAACLMTEGAREPVTARTVAAAAVFVVGLSTVFVALGTGASTIGGILRQYLDELAIIAGLVTIFMGLHFLGLTRIAVLMRHAHLDVRRPTGLGGAYVMGCAFAFAWTPCIGPVLAAILTIAATESTVARGAGLLAVYSAGLGLPFIAAAALCGPFATFMLRFRPQLVRVERVMGGLLVLAGVAFIVGAIRVSGSWRPFRGWRA